MCFLILFSLFDNCLKYSWILSHNGRFEINFYICWFMRVDFSLFCSNFKCKIFIRLRISFSDIKFNCARYFIRINYFKFLINSIWIIAWYYLKLKKNIIKKLFIKNVYCAKIKAFFFIIEYIWTYDACNILTVYGAWNNNLFFKYLFKIVTDYSWNTALSYYFI